MTLTIPEIDVIVKELDRESKALRKEIYTIAWYMRGALSINEAFCLDAQDREIIAEIIESNLETTKETKLPFF